MSDDVIPGEVEPGLGPVPPDTTGGPLAGLRVIEIGGIGPAPFAAMLFADMGAEIVRIERASQTVLGGEAETLVYRGRRRMALDLKNPMGREVLLDMVAEADVLIEGFRPGVMEHLGVGPEPCTKRNPRLVYGRMTGWGQTGPYSTVVGHDLNYLSIAGALGLLGSVDRPPTPPLNIVGDYNGAPMLFAFGIMCALFDVPRSGRGQVVDGSTLDTMSLVLLSVWNAKGQHAWRDERNANALDGGAHFYNVYECSDGRYVSLAPVEPKFYAELLRLLGISDPTWISEKWSPSDWDGFKNELMQTFKTKTRDEWCDLLEHTDTCFAPVLTPDEAVRHPQNVARGRFFVADGVVQPSPAPVLSRTPGSVRLGFQDLSDPQAILPDWGFDADSIIAKRRAGAFGDT